MLPVRFISDKDVEFQMESEIERSGLWPQKAGELFHIENFLTGHLGADLDQDAILEEHVMGEVTFKSRRRPCVAINADLTFEAERGDAIWKKGRWRMTVAHESAHVILHGPLYAAVGQRQLWDDDEPQIHRCYKKDMPEHESSEERLLPGHQLRWDSGQLFNETDQTKRMEFQANIAASALLMPRQKFMEYAQSLFEMPKTENFTASPEGRMDWAIARLAEQFCVSRQAARIRFNKLNLAHELQGARLIPRK